MWKKRNERARLLSRTRTAGPGRCRSDWPASQNRQYNGSLQVIGHIGGELEGGVISGVLGIFGPVYHVPAPCVLRLTPRYMPWTTFFPFLLFTRLPLYLGS